MNSCFAGFVLWFCVRLLVMRLTSRSHLMASLADCDAYKADPGEVMLWDTSTGERIAVA